MVMQAHLKSYADPILSYPFSGHPCSEKIDSEWEISHWEGKKFPLVWGVEILESRREAALASLSDCVWKRLQQNLDE